MRKTKPHDLNKFNAQAAFIFSSEKALPQQMLGLVTKLNDICSQSRAGGVVTQNSKRDDVYRKLRISIGPKLYKKLRPLFNIEVF